MEVGRKGKADPDAGRKKAGVSREDSLRWRIDVEDYESDTGDETRSEVRHLGRRNYFSVSNCRR